LIGWPAAILESVREAVAIALGRSAGDVITERGSRPAQFTGQTGSL